MNIYVLDAIAIGSTLICLRFFLSWTKRRASGYPLPPGPKGLPIIGSILDVPSENEWEFVRQLGAEYGDLIYIKKFGMGYLFLNSYEDAIELFEKRGSMYSGRPQPTLMTLEGWHDWFTAVIPYGDKLRKARQYFNKMFQRTVTKNYHDVQSQSVHKLLLKLLQDSDNFRDHIRHTAAETIVKVAYGYEITEDDPVVGIIERGVRAITEALALSHINALPALRFIPSWFPGARFHKMAKEGYEAATTMYSEPYERAKVKMADGTANSSMLSNLIEMYGHTDKLGSNEMFIAQSAATALAAGGDTIVSVLSTFFLAMALYPDAMRKGQKEIDSVIGRNDLPTFQDKPRLPYVEAIWLECLRWQTVTPIGVPHLVETDDVYKGYFIPAGTVVYGNVWAMLRDPKRYPEETKFIPERWLSSDGKERPLESNKMAFGFGRRICPGRFFAENSIFIAIASILATFDIERATDEQGVPIIPSEEYTTSLSRHPKPFKCIIAPRSNAAAAIVREAAAFAKSTS